MKKRIALILPYFGKLPNYFQVWLCSAGKNEFIDFYIFTDNRKENYILYDNIKWYETKFDHLKKRIYSILPYKICIDDPYKICDFRPLFGLIFQNYISEYEFWGHCDPDIIWGDLSKFLTSNILNNYDKIYNRGHLVLYRNIKKINYMVLKELPNSYLKAKLVFQTRYSAHFDESNLLNRYIKYENLRVYEQVDCADVDYMFMDFRIVNLFHERELVDYFDYNEGHIYGYKQNEKIEYSYLHLQKRNIKINSTIDLNNFKIYPNLFINSNVSKEICEATNKEKIRYRKQKKRELFLRRINNLKSGAIKFRILGFLEKIRRWDR